MYQGPGHVRDQLHETQTTKFSDEELWYQQNTYAMYAQQRCADSNAATMDFNDQSSSWSYPYLANHQVELTRNDVTATTNYPLNDPTSAASSCHMTRYSSEDKAKPPYSYAALICMAIGSAPDKKATMREILNYIEQNFSYYRSHKRWHGTIRHDLTVNDCFVKLSARPKQKGCLWIVAPDYQDMFANGSLRRRRYRFKEGSAKWLKSRAENASKIRRKTAKPAGRETDRCARASPDQLTNPPTSHLDPVPSASQRSSPIPPFALSTSTETVIPRSHCAYFHPNTFDYSNVMPLVQCKTDPELIFPDGKDSSLENSEDCVLVFPNSVSPFPASSGYNSAESSPEFSHQYATY